MAASLRIEMAKGGDGAPAKHKVAEVAMGVAQRTRPKIERSSTPNAAEEVPAKVRVPLEEQTQVICIVLVKSGGPASECTGGPASMPLNGPVCDKTAERHSVDR